jgi:hypothetical protein
MGKNKIWIIFRELGNNFLVKKTLKFFYAYPDWIRNPFARGSGVEKFGSGINIPESQHWLVPPSVNLAAFKDSLCTKKHFSGA